MFAPTPDVPPPPYAHHPDASRAHGAGNTTPVGQSARQLLTHHVEGEGRRALADALRDELAEGTLKALPLREGAERVTPIARDTCDKVKHAMGIYTS